MKRLVLPGSALLVAATVLSIHLVTATGTSPRSGRVAVTHTRATPTGAIVGGRVVSGLGNGPAKLEVAATAPLAGSLVPVAVPSPDGAYLAYNTWHWTRSIDWYQSLSSQGIRTGDRLGTPVLRLRSRGGGKDVALEPGTFSAAWRQDGALAYVKGEQPDYRANTPFLRNVVVRSSPDAAPTVWSSSAGEYHVLGWAGRHLIVAQQFEGEAISLVAFDGQGSARPLAQNASLVAISPDGSSALVDEGPADTAAPALRLVSVADATELARVPFSTIVDPTTSTPVAWVTGPGDWFGDRVVASTSTGVVVLHIAGNRISVEQVLHVDSATRPNGRLWEPRFADDGRTIITWTDLPESKAAQIVCDRFALTCTQGPAVPAADAPRPVYDESGGNR
jgi:hypothetical protein